MRGAAGSLLTPSCTRRYRVHPMKWRASALQRLMLQKVWSEDLSSRTSGSWCSNCKLWQRYMKTSEAACLMMKDYWSLDFYTLNHKVRSFRDQRCHFLLFTEEVVNFLTWKSLNRSCCWWRIIILADKPTLRLGYIRPERSNHKWTALGSSVPLWH